LSGAGFTLIELLVVVAVLSATALAAFGLIAEDRAQVRMDDTRVRLGILRRATVGVDAPAYGGEMRLSGFVADNGRLPEAIVDLLKPPEGYARQTDTPAPNPPKLATTLDNKCFPVGSVNTLPPDTPLLLKGHRGHYLAGATHNDVFRDGWGNFGDEDNTAGDTADKRNFGWQVGSVIIDDAPLPDSLAITSLGADNMVGKATNMAAEEEVGTEIRPQDWLVPLKGWKVTLTNKSGRDLIFSSDFPPAADSGELGVTLLVFENSSEDTANSIPDGGRWRQLRSAVNSCAGESSLVADASCEFSFTETLTCGGGTIDARVPLGRHLVLLTLDNQSPPDPGASGKPDLRRLRATVDFHPGALQPELRWEIR
jgi:prepilin-type N-terminal cleavage/methylation domain-containing protein